MIGMTLTHRQSGLTGTVDAQTVSPDGRAMVRIEDRWFMADEVEA